MLEDQGCYAQNGCVLMEEKGSMGGLRSVKWMAGADSLCCCRRDKTQEVSTWGPSNWYPDGAETKG